ncbi:MAG: TraR/DksA C4-type zinc finger protein [Bacteroidales bacterium]|nr:TraR/DksA C4-type zinc finger protein [Bacteroidales bacterium]
MTEEEKKQLREKLLQEKKKVEKRIENLKDLTKPIAPENSIGRVSRMDAINNKSINDAALRTAENKLKNIEEALGKTHHKDFGKCRRCGQPIPMGRLAVMPESVLCMRCAQM